MTKSNNKRLDAKTGALHDNFPNMTLNFIETDKANQNYPVTFKFEEVVLDTDERFVFKGLIRVSGHQYSVGYIEYQHLPSKKWPNNFYRITYSGNGVIKHMYPLKPHPRYIRNIEDVWAFMRDLKYAEKENEYIVDHEPNMPTQCQYIEM